MRWNVINMLRQAQDCLENRHEDSGGYAYGLECLRENLEQLRDGKVTFEQFAEFYCLTERDRPAAKALEPCPLSSANLSSRTLTDDVCRCPACASDCADITPCMKGDAR